MPQEALYVFYKVSKEEDRNCRNESQKSMQNSDSFMPPFFAVSTKMKRIDSNM